MINMGVAKMNGGKFVQYVGDDSMTERDIWVEGTFDAGE